jgi:hypothetical protein
VPEADVLISEALPNHRFGADQKLRAKWTLPYSNSSRSTLANRGVPDLVAQLLRCVVPELELGVLTHLDRQAPVVHELPSVEPTLHEAVGASAPLDLHAPRVPVAEHDRRVRPGEAVVIRGRVV